MDAPCIPSDCFVSKVYVSWAFHKSKQEDALHHPEVFVGNLDSAVQDQALFAAFKHCKGCSGARVLTDRKTSRFEMMLLVLLSGQCQKIHVDAHHAARTLSNLCG